MSGLGCGHRAAGGSPAPSRILASSEPTSLPDLDEIACLPQAFILGLSLLGTQLFFLVWDGRYGLALPALRLSLFSCPLFSALWLWPWQTPLFYLSQVPGALPLSQQHLLPETSPLHIPIPVPIAHPQRGVTWRPPFTSP